MPLVTEDCHLIIMDTVVNNMPDEFFHDRPWGNKNKPKIAVGHYLQTKIIHNKIEKLIIERTFINGEF